MALPTPTWEAIPPNSGSVDIVGGTPSVPTGWPAGYAEWQQYTYTATPASGYRFDHFEIITWHHDTDESGLEDYDNSDNPLTTTNNPYITSDGTAPNYDDGSAYWYDYGYIPGLEGVTSSVTAIHCKAYFVPTHTPTHLLVNGENVSNLLVYDDRVNGTGLLVADY